MGKATLETSKKKDSISKVENKVQKRMEWIEDELSPVTIVEDGKKTRWDYVALEEGLNIVRVYDGKKPEWMLDVHIEDPLKRKKTRIYLRSPEILDSIIEKLIHVRDTRITTLEAIKQLMDKYQPRGSRDKKPKVFVDLDG